MRFVALKSVAQQQVLMLHRLRAGVVKSRTALVNQLRGVLGEFGLVVAQGIGSLRRALPEILEDGTNPLPALVREELALQLPRLRELDAELRRLSGRIEALAGTDERVRGLMHRRGVGALIASAFCAEIGDPHVFKNGRQVAAWLGLVPKQRSSGGTTVLLGISKRGNAYLRTLLIHGARAAVRVAPRHPDPISQWILQLKARRGVQKPIVAVANKMARQMWAELAYS